MAFTDTDGSDFVVGQVWGKFGAPSLVRRAQAKVLGGTIEREPPRGGAPVAT